MTLRNLPEQTPFVVEWQYPLMVERPLLRPEKLKGKGGRPAVDHTAELLELLNDKPMTTTEWQMAAKTESDIKRSVFYEQFKSLKSHGFVENTPCGKKWQKPGTPKAVVRQEPKAVKALAPESLALVTPTR